VVTALNPMTYVSELMRGAMVPSVPHIQPWICLVVLAFSVNLLIAVGLRGFYRRAIGESGLRRPHREAFRRPAQRTVSLR